MVVLTVVAAVMMTVVVVEVMNMETVMVVPMMVKMTDCDNRAFNSEVKNAGKTAKTRHTAR